MPRSPHAPHALVIGEAIVDVVVDRGHRRERPGGSPLNVAVGLARLGVRTTLHTRLGRDPHGDLLRQHLTDSGARLTPTSTGPRPTATSTALIGPDGAATYDFDLCWDPAPVPPISDTDLVHVGSIGALVAPGAQAVRDAVVRYRAEATVSFDPNVRPQLLDGPDRTRPAVEDLVRRSDIVKSSDEDVAWLYPGADPLEVAERWLGLGACLVVITRGEHGALALATSGRIDVPSARGRVVDTVGAGDSFMAAMLAALCDAGLVGADRRDALRRASQHDLHRVLTFAAGCAGITVGRPGADPPHRHDLAGTC